MVGLDNPIHLLFLLVIVLLIFGAKRLPEMGRSLGSGMRGFKESISGENTPPVGESSTPTDPARALNQPRLEPPGRRKPPRASPRQSSNELKTDDQPQGLKIAHEAHADADPLLLAHG